MANFINLLTETGDLDAWNMSIRAFFVFIFCLFFIRIAGRRSFGLRAPFDNIILILLGALLARAVTGSSPFFPVCAASLIICVLHRILGWLSLYSSTIEKIIKGTKLVLYEHGEFNQRNLLRSLVSKDDVQEEIRLSGLGNSIEDFEIIYMEANGKISVIKKNI